MPARAKTRPCLLRALALALAPVLAGCGGGSTVPAPLPRRLADTGLYADFARGTLHPDAIPYEPNYPLWTDGARKARWIRLPAGGAVDASDPDRWTFPVGTRLWKEFAFERRVETRYMERLPDGTWRFATYLWSADGREALLAPAVGVRGAAHLDGGVAYDVPSVVDCRACHGAEGHVLGFSLLQLSPARDPLAPHAVTPGAGAVDLPALVARGQLAHLPSRLLSEPPVVPAASPRERAVLGYLHGNCAGCHAPGRAPGGVDLDLEVRFGHGEPEVGALRSAVGRATAMRGGPAQDAPWLVAPGDVRGSLLHLRLATRDPSLQMPPLGSRVVDAPAAALLEAWIREDLDGSTSPDLPPTQEKIR